jgi:hypothetical protein
VILRPDGRLALLGRHRPGPSEGYLAPSEERRTRHQLPPGMCVASLLENGTEESQKPVRGDRASDHRSQCTKDGQHVRPGAGRPKGISVPEAGSPIVEIALGWISMISMESLILAQDERWRRA